MTDIIKIVRWEPEMSPEDLGGDVKIYHLVKVANKTSLL